MPFAMELDSVQPRTSFATAVNRSRLKFLGWWKRLYRWEFWPPYLFYPPVIAYIAYLGTRYRSWTLLTAANPGIPAGGFVGGSKHSTFDHLSDAVTCLPCSTLFNCAVPRQPVAE